MSRSILSVVLGVVAGMLLVGAIESIGHHFYSSTEDININDEVAMIAFMNSLPVQALLIVVIAHGMGGFIAGLVASTISLQNRFSIGLLAGCIILLFAIITLFSIDGHPTWMKIGDPIFILIMLYLGAGIGASRKSLFPASDTTFQ